jgi:hypothetical protein
VTLLADARWLTAFYHLLWMLPQHAQTVLQTLRLMLDHIPKGSSPHTSSAFRTQRFSHRVRVACRVCRVRRVRRVSRVSCVAGRGNVQLANMGLQPLLAEIISLHPGDVGIVGHALEIASRFGSGPFSSFHTHTHTPDLTCAVTCAVRETGMGLEKWLAPERMAALLRAMRDHPRQITVVEPALLVLTLLENRGHGPALVAAGAFRALAQAGANYPAAFDVAQWTPESCVVVNTATLIDLLRTHGSPCPHIYGRLVSRTDACAVCAVVQWCVCAVCAVRSGGGGA